MTIRCDGCGLAMPKPGLCAMCQSDRHNDPVSEAAFALARSRETGLDWSKVKPRGYSHASGRPVRVSDKGAKHGDNCHQGHARDGTDCHASCCSVQQVSGRQDVM